MSKIYQNDQGTILEFTVTENEQPVNITGTTVSVSMEHKEEAWITEKVAKITDAENGKCQITLTSSDTALKGSYSLKAAITFENGNVFHSDPVTYRIYSST